MSERDRNWQRAPYADGAYIDKANRKLGAVPEEFERLSAARRDAIMRRMADWNLVDANSLNGQHPDAFRETFIEMRHVIRLLISDHLARRPWWRRVLGLR